MRRVLDCHEISKLPSFLAWKLYLPYTVFRFRRVRTICDMPCTLGERGGRDRPLQTLDPDRFSHGSQCRRKAGEPRCPPRPTAGLRRAGRANLRALSALRGEVGIYSAMTSMVMATSTPRMPFPLHVGCLVNGLCRERRRELQDQPIGPNYVNSAVLLIWGELDMKLPSVSVVMPALNEAQNIPHVFARMPLDVHEVILVDGFSVDETVAVARQLRPDVRVIQQSRKGKGNALACGIAVATGDVIALVDADGSADPGEIPRFVEALINGADFAKGTRFAEGGGSADITRLRSYGNYALRLFLTLATAGITQIFAMASTSSGGDMQRFWAWTLLHRRDPVVMDGFGVMASRSRPSFTFVSPTLGLKSLKSPASSTHESMV